MRLSIELPNDIPFEKIKIIDCGELLTDTNSKLSILNGGKMIKVRSTKKSVKRSSSKTHKKYKTHKKTGTHKKSRTHKK